MFSTNSLVERASSVLKISGRGPRPCFRSRRGSRGAGGHTVRRLLRDDGGQRVDRAQEEIGELGAAVMAGLGHIGCERLPGGRHQRLVIVFTIRVQTGVVIEEIAFRRDIQVPPSRIFTPMNAAE